MTFQLWPHQWDAITAVANAFGTGRKGGLWEIPTGGGKTVAFLTLASGLGLRTLVLVHRDELVRQTLDTAARVWPQARVGVMQGRLHQWGDRDLVVASVPSLRGDRLAEIPATHFSLLVADECHHAPAPSWSAVLGHFEPAFLLGVTATPDRLDGQGLAGWFGPEPLYVYPLRRAIEDGVLARLRQFAVTTGVALDDVAVRAGDFATAELSRAVATAARNQAVVEAYRAYGRGRKAIAFAVDLAHVELLTRAFAGAGFRAASVTGLMPLEERRRVLADFGSGRFDVLVNCEVCTEGYDDRAVSCVIMTRPTRSRALYQQCVGRGLRVCPETGKRDCLVLDITDNCRRHQLVTVFDLFGAPRLRDAGGKDVLEEVGRDEEARRIDVAERPWPVVAEGRDPVQWGVEEVPPWPDLPDLQGYRPTQAWQTEPATPRQVGYLEGLGLFVRPGLSKGEAHHLIAQCKRAEDLYPPPATPKQQWFLKSQGRWAEGMSKRDATGLIAVIKQQEGALAPCVGA
jgi:superfamily II DNA or RNA helicase